MRVERPWLRAGAYMRLQVEDTGTGMDAAFAARAFEPFVTTKPKGSGAGLGLATVYGLVKQSNGFVWVESAPQAGTRVDRAAADRWQPGTAPRRRRRRRLRPCVRDLPRVLLVEDESAVRELLSSALERNGFDVVTRGQRRGSADAGVAGVSDSAERHQPARHERRSAGAAVAAHAAGAARAADVRLRARGVRRRGPTRWTTCRSFPSRLRRAPSSSGCARSSSPPARRCRRSRRWSVETLLLAGLAGALLALSFPKFGHPACAWIALVPLFLALSGWTGRPGPLPGTSARRGFRARAGDVGRLLQRHALLDRRRAGHVRRPAGAAWGRSACCCCRSTSGSTSPSAPPRSACCWRAPATAGLWLAPAAWVTGEYLRGTLLSGFPWVPLGDSQIEMLADCAGGERGRRLRHVAARRVRQRRHRLRAAGAAARPRCRRSPARRSRSSASPSGARGAWPTAR